MSHLTWKETRPGRWERPLSCLEKINLVNRNIEKALDKDNWAKTVVAKLEFDPALGDPEDALRIAWKQVRYNYPEVAAFPYNGTYMYRTGHPEQIELWVTATFSVVDNMTIDDLLGHIPRNEQMMCYYLPHTSEVLVRSPHYRLDARGAIFCLNYLIESLANLDPILVFGGCAKNLSPSIDDALDTSCGCEANGRTGTTLPTSRADTNTTVKVARSYKRTFIRLSRRETKAITSGLESASMRCTTALHAALISAVAKLAPPSEPKSFMASFHCDLRNFITKPVTTKKAPMTCTSTLTREVEVSPTTDYQSYFEQLAPAYEAGYAPYLESTACFHEKLTATKYGSPKVNAAAESQPQPRFSALGNIDKELTKSMSGVVRVKDFWLGTETLTKCIMVHAWVWEEQLVLSCCYNESFWDTVITQSLLAEMKNTLMREVALGR